MAKTFRQMVGEAREQVEVLSPEQAQERMKQNPGAVLIDVQEPDDFAAPGAIPGSINVPLGMLPIRADNELPEAMRDARLKDRDAPVITTCAGGGQAALAAKTLKDMGFTNVSMVDGGRRGWKAAGLPTD